ncbi:MAG: hypothetical protein GY817_06295 [bacterium]|nr:hypothetical protein [bacterium]
MELNDCIKSREAEGKEKHVPGLKLTGCSPCGDLGLTISVGDEVPHPTTPEHHIKHLGVHGLTKDNKLVFITRLELGDGYVLPNVKINIKPDVFTKVFVTSFCNIHGLWENSIDI